jgi:predicted RNA binding protein YcfA (HicA-like mRNA interferase family)
LKKAGWVEVSQKGSHMKMKHDTIPEMIIFPNHGSQEIGKGLEMKIKKIAGL